MPPNDSVLMAMNLRNSFSNRGNITVDIHTYTTGLNFMALLTVSKDFVSAEAGNSVLMSIVFHRLARNFGLCVWVFHVTRHSTLTQLVQKCGVAL